MKRIKSTLFPMLALALSGRAVFAGPPPAPKKDDPAPHDPHEEDSLEELQQKMLEVHGQQEAIRATADKEHRRLNEEEAKQLEDLGDQFDALDVEVTARKRLIAQKEKLATPAPRKVPPSDLPEAGSRQRITGGELVGATKNSWGFRSIGEFAKSVVQAGRGQLDPRIVAAAGTYGSEGSNADGGYAVPPDFREPIVKQLQGEQSLLSMTDQQYTSSNKITVPLDSSTPWQTVGGILATWETEAAATTPTKPALGTIEVKANKLKALVPITDELLEDAPALSRYLPGKVADKFTSKLNDGIVNGDGAGKPSGLLDSGSVLEVAIENAQDLDGPILFANIAKMWAALYAPLRQEAVWLINQSLEPSLLTMTVPGTQPSYPAYLPPGGLSVKPYATLMGAPVIPIEACQAVGTPGDIILTNLKQYLTVQKVGGLRQDVSMHLYFDQDIQAFRFILRVGGESWWQNKAARLNGGDYVSNIVTLGQRSA